METLLTNKLGEMENSSPLWKIKDDEKLVQSITKLKNCLTDLKSMAKIHKIENSLFHTSNLAKIFQLIGRLRQSKITKKFLKSSLTDEQKWETIIHFLDEELKVKEQMLLFENCYSAKNEGKGKPKGKEVPFRSFLILRLKIVLSVMGVIISLPSRLEVIL